MDAIADWTLAAPWWLLAAAAVAAVAFLLFALARRERRLTQVALAGTVLAIAWAGLATFIQTPTERALSRTEDMINAYESANWQRLNELVDSETRFSNLLKGQEIVAAARETHKELGHTDLRINSLEAQRDGVGVLVFARISTNQPADYRVPPTAWKFDYRKRGDEWKLERIDPVATELVETVTILRNVRLPAELRNRAR